MPNKVPKLVLTNFNTCFTPLTSRDYSKILPTMSSFRESNKKESSQKIDIRRELLEKLFCGDGGTAHVPFEHDPT